jgi:hypothetical protein
VSEPDGARRPRLAAVPPGAEAPPAAPFEPRRGEAGPGPRPGRAAWLVALALAACAGAGLLYEARRAATLEARLAEADGELAEARARLAAYDGYLGAVRARAAALRDELSHLGELLARDPGAGAPGEPAGPGAGRSAAPQE